MQRTRATALPSCSVVLALAADARRSAASLLKLYYSSVIWRSPMMKWKDPLRDYIPIQVIKALVQHTISTILAILCFWLTALLVNKVFPEGIFHNAIEVIKDIGFITLLG